MPRWNQVVVLSLFVVVAGASLGLVSQRHEVASLTAEDHIAIEQLYFAYTHAIDLGEPEGRDYAAVFTPDGVFALVMPNPSATAGISRSGFVLAPVRAAASRSMRPVWANIYARVWLTRLPLISRDILAWPTRSRSVARARLSSRLYRS